MGKFTRIKKILIFLVAAYYPILGFSADNTSNVKREIYETREKNSQAVVEQAYTWVGVVELTGNNDHPRITEAMELCGLKGDRGYSWCAASQAKIHYDAGVEAPHSARVIDWFNTNTIWKREWGDKLFEVKPGMVGAIYYKSLKRYGHIVLIIGEDRNNYYTLEGNTNASGSRNGQGFYKKIRSKESISAISDYCLDKEMFEQEYDSILKRFNAS